MREERKEKEMRKTIEDKHNRYPVVMIRHIPVQTYPATYQIIDRGIVRHGDHPVLLEGTEEECRAYQEKHNLYEAI